MLASARKSRQEPVIVLVVKQRMYSSQTILGGFRLPARPFRNHSAGTALIIVTGSGSGCARNIQCQVLTPQFLLALLHTWSFGSISRRQSFITRSRGSRH